MLVSLVGGVGSVGAFPKLPLIVKVLLDTILTILYTAQYWKVQICYYITNFADNNRRYVITRI